MKRIRNVFAAMRVHNNAGVYGLNFISPADCSRVCSLPLAYIQFCEACDEVKQDPSRKAALAITPMLRAARQTASSPSILSSPPPRTSHATFTDLHLLS